MSMPERPPQLAAPLVQEFVIACHGNLELVKEMLDHNPALLNATWDWGGGDFENGLEGAAHTGQREIALYLIEKGARVNLFAAAMLGQLEVVKSILEANPSAIHSTGAHGISLLRHAQVGGEQSSSIVAYIKSVNV